MNEEIIRAKYYARKCENQMEFDRLMTAMNEEQSRMNHPYLDRERELSKERARLYTQREAINIQLDQVRLERLELEEKRKKINRLFHELKHELIMVNPREEGKTDVGVW